SGGMISGLSRRRAVDFSFLMAIPAVLGSAVLGAKDIRDMAEAANVSFGTQFGELVTQLGGAAPLLIGMGTAALAGFLAVRLMLYIVRHIGLRWFAVYTFLLGAFLIARQVLTA
ncbi:MAG: undecaprenyl-diphosphate phosphatase, partial [Clostridia bacterium]|nr:undecaprenyl-diphosphate phosphatase [Clostridia bacterium]